MQNTDTNMLNLRQFRQMFPISNCLNMGDDVCLVDVRYDESLDVLRHPCRFDGLLVFFCLSGNIGITINLTEFNVVENSLFVYLPGSIVRVAEVEDTVKPDIHFLVMAMSRQYMETLNVNTSRLLDSRLMLLDRPFLLIQDKEKEIAGEYIMLAESILRSNLSYKRESISMLITSMFFLMSGIIEQDRGRDCVTVRQGQDRSKSVSDRFIRLVTEYYAEERSVSFYAGRLCLTPKYLSKLVKEATGKSAPDWISDFVILEAKNMLKYSDMPIKEIVSRLNFTNMSAFHKFFKARTGITPAKYRKS